MSKLRWWLVSVVGGLALVMGASIALAADLDDGAYTLSLPGVGDFVFTVDGETVSTTMTPTGYVIDDDDPDKVAWKDTATLSLEVEAKTNKVEGDHDWAQGDATLTLPDGGTITITQPDGEGNFTVTTTGGWSAFGSGSDWYVANNADINAATKFFKVEATADGIEIIAVDSADEGFLNDLEEDEEEEAEIEEEEEEEEEEDDGPPGEGRGGPDG